MKKLLTLSLAAALAGPAFAERAVDDPVVGTERYTIDGRHSMPSFEVNHLGFSTQRGRFEKLEGAVTLDRAAGTGAIQVSIDTASLSMGLEDWDKHMKSEDFFDVEKHPRMTFKSDKLVFEDGKPVAAEGQFTLLGVTRPLTLKVANFHCAPHPMNQKPTCGADVTGTLKRSEFGMSKYAPAVGDEVKLIIPVEAFRD